jgi:hypothetical protein
MIPERGAWLVDLHTRHEDAHSRIEIEYGENLLSSNRGVEREKIVNSLVAFER